MFVFDRSALAILVPLAMLAGAVIWSNRPASEPAAHSLADEGEGAARAAHPDQTVAANFPSR